MDQLDEDDDKRGANPSKPDGSGKGKRRGAGAGSADAENGKGGGSSASGFQLNLQPPENMEELWVSYIGA